MAMQIIWTDRFNKSIEYMFTCAQDIYSKKNLKALNTALKFNESLLKENPLIGALEPLLVNRDYTYRHIVIKPFFKVIYTVIDNNIYMIDIWDTRRLPSNLTNGIA